MMLTEFVRKHPCDLMWDKGVNPTNRQLHRMALPFTLKGEMSPLPTGFMLPNGKEQPFVHVMFPRLQANARSARLLRDCLVRRGARSLCWNAPFCYFFDVSCDRTNSS